MVLRSSLFAAVFFFVSCVSVERNNPEDPGSPNYVGKSSSSSDKEPLSSARQSSSSVAPVAPSSSSVPPPSSSSSSMAVPSSSSVAAPPPSSSSIIIITACPNAVTGNNSMSCDGQSYRTVEIGEQVWMAENLNYAASGSKCGEDDGKLSDDNTSNCDKYGRLYNWATAMALDASCNASTCASQVGAKHQGICPSSWHIPNDDDLDKLVNFVESSNSCSNCTAKYLKYTDGWNNNGNNNGNGQDTYGFSALPGGYGSNSDGSFYSVGNYGFWWSSTEYSSIYAYRWEMNYIRESVGGSNIGKFGLYSVRCVKD